MLVIPMVFSAVSWKIVLTGFLIMHIIQSVFLLFTFFMTHHVLETDYPETNTEGIIQTSWLMNQVKSSNDMHPFSELANFSLGRVQQSYRPPFISSNTPYTLSQLEQNPLPDFTRP